MNDSFAQGRGALKPSTLIAKITLEDVKRSDERDWQSLLTKFIVLALHTVALIPILQT